MVLSGRFVALVALGVVPIVAIGQAGGEPLLVLGVWLLFCVLLGVLDLVLAGSPRTVRITRVLPDRTRLGESVTSDLALENLGRRRLRAVVRDAWQPSTRISPSRARLTVPPRERRMTRFTLTPARRGERRVEQVTIRSWGPLHLWARQATLRAPGRLRVLPPFIARKHLPSRLARLRELDGATRLMVRGQGTEFDSLREYVRGDDVRSIDWRATARRHDEAASGNKLVVRTWRPERDRRVVIVVDTSRTSAARIGDEPRIDTAFESALLLAALATRAGDRVDLIAYDRRVRARVQGATGADLLAKMVDALAGVDPELIEMDWNAIPAQVQSITSHRALVVVLTSVDAAGMSTGLLSVLPQLTRKHLVVIASATDPELTQITASPQNRDEVYLAASAERSLLDVARVSAAINQLGGDVVTAEPQDLPPALADRYLDLKAAGRL